MQNNGHLFLIDHIRSGLHICLTVAEINRRIYAFNGIGQHTEHLIFIIQIRNHIGIIDSCKRLIVGVLKQGRRTNGDRRLHHIEESKEVFNQTVGQLRFQEVFQNRIVISIGKGNLIQIIAIHKLVEYIGTKHHCFRDSHTGILKFFKFRMTLHHIVNKRQSTPLSSQRTVSDTGKV